MKKLLLILLCLPFLVNCQIIEDYSDYDATLFASGSEVEIALEASKKLEKNNFKVRVISFPSMELFELQEEDYKKNIIGNKTCFATEAGVINGWEKYVKYENFIGMKSFGASGPYKDVYKHFEITSDNIYTKIKTNLTT